jgi:hypothetical protein
MTSLLKPPIELRNGYKDKKRLAALYNLPCVNCKAKGRRQTTRTIAHHRIGLGLGKKASDLLTCSICEDCHTGKNGIHNTPLWKWEEENSSQDRLIELTNEMLGL